MIAYKMRKIANIARRDKAINDGVFDVSVWNSILERVQAAALEGEYAVLIGRNEIAGFQDNKETFFDELIDEGFIIYEKDSGSIIISWVENTVSIFEEDVEETF